MQGFYGVYYTGQTGSAAFGLLLRGGLVYGVDAAGGDIAGTYSERTDGGLDLALTFHWPAGAVLVTGQTLTMAMSVPANMTIAAACISGSDQVIDLPIGKVMVRLKKKLALT
jgi:hypothetical protein